MSAERRAARLTLLRSTDLFASLPSDALAGVADAVREMAWPAGSIVVREDEPGDCLFVVAEGDVQVFLAQSACNEVVLARLGPGEVFGEQYLLEESGRRTASVRCRSDAVLLRIATADFRALLDAHPALSRWLRQRGEQYSEAKAARRSELAKLLRLEGPQSTVRVRRFAPGAVVFRQGDPADAFYFVLSGRAVVYLEATPECALHVLEPGQGFGELALLNDAPRTASVRAETELLVQLVPRDHFLRRHEQSPAVRERMAALSFVYRMPQRGVALQWVGRHDDQESIERSYRLDDGRTWASTFLLSERVFRLEATSALTSATVTTHTWTDAERGMSRTVDADTEGRIVGLLGVGLWSRLPDLMDAALDGRPLGAEAFSSFETTGAVYLDAVAPPPLSVGGRAEQVVCFCLQLPRGSIHREIRGGCQTFEELRSKTGCGTVCGGCEPAVKGLLGNASWSPAAATSIPVQEDLRCLRLYPKGGSKETFVPGQHIGVEGFVDGHWVSRSYTLISPPNEASYREICVKREDHGLFSQWLFAGNLEDKALLISAPRGVVRWQPGDRPTVCFVAGIGVTPALCIVRAVRTANTKHRVHIDYSARTQSRLAFRDELASAANEHITLRLRATSVEGRLTMEEVQAAARDLPNADFHVCGPQAFMDLVQQSLRSLGVPAARVKVETFVHAGAPQREHPGASPQQAPRATSTGQPTLPPRRWFAFGAGLLIALAVVSYWFVTHVSPP